MRSDGRRAHYGFRTWSTSRMWADTAPAAALIRTAGLYAGLRPTGPAHRHHCRPNTKDPCADLCKPLAENEQKPSDYQLTLENTIRRDF